MINGMRFFTGFVFSGLICFAAAQSAEAAPVLTNPAVLNPGATLSPIPDGVTGPGSTDILGFPVRYNFDFSAVGGPTGRLIESIFHYPDITDALHPYGSGLIFGFEIVLTAGNVASLTIGGYSGFDASVKQCSVIGCGSPPLTTNGVAATSASRTADGDAIKFSFSGLSGTKHSGLLQIFTDASDLVDPPAIFQNANGDIFSLDVVGPAAATPLPAALPLFASGLGAMGLFAWRRKRIDAAVRTQA